MKKKPGPLTLEAAAYMSDAEVQKAFAKLDEAGRLKLALELVLHARDQLRKQLSGA